MGTLSSTMRHREPAVVMVRDPRGEAEDHRGEAEDVLWKRSTGVPLLTAPHAANGTTRRGRLLMSIFVSLCGFSAIISSR